MKITKIQLFELPASGQKLLCYARVEFDDGALRVANVEIWKSNKDGQIRVGWPTRRWPNGSWTEVVTPNSLVRNSWDNQILQFFFSRFPQYCDDCDKKGD